MGITWVHEDSQEAVLAGTETVPDPGGRAPIRFACPFCTSLFADFAAMQRHASSVHHLERPLLMWGEQEVGRDRKISSRRTFGVASCTRAFMAVDGADYQRVGISDLLVVLGSATDCVLRISQIEECRGRAGCSRLPTAPPKTISERVTQAG